MLQKRSFGFLSTMNSAEIDKLADAVKSGGATSAFGILGSGRSLELASAIEERGIIFHRTYFEGSAAIMAGVSGLLAGNCGLAISIKGPGLSNMIPGIALCKFENFPMVALSESFEEGESLERAHKYLDHPTMVGPIVKASGACSPVESGFLRAQLLAKEEVPGPVHLDLISSKKRIVPKTGNISVKERGTGPHQHDVLKILGSAKKPAIILGSVCHRLGLKNSLETLAIPTFTTVAAKGLVDENLPFSAGIYTGAGVANSPEKSILTQADVVFSIGLRLNEILVQSVETQNIINLDVPVSRDEIRGNIKTFFSPVDEIKKLIEFLSTFEWGRNLVKQTRNTLLNLFDSTGFLPWNVYQELQRKLPNSSRYVIDTGNFCTIAEHSLVCRESNQTLFSANGRYMGTALPMGIGAALVDPNRRTIVICGDGGIGMHVSEIKIAVEAKLPVLVVLMSDGGYASILGNARQRGLNEDLLSISDPCWVGVLAALGMESVQVENEAEFKRALEQFDSKPKPFFIECKFDQNAYLKMTQTLRA